MDRVLESFMPNYYPSGRFLGTADFTRVYESVSSGDREFSSSCARNKPDGMSTINTQMDDDTRESLKYLETGRLETSTGLTFDATRRYQYIYSESEDRMDVFFADSSRSGFFHSLRFLPQALSGVDAEQMVRDGYDGTWEPWVGEKRCGWRAVGNYWWQYIVRCWFAFRGVHLDEFRIAHKGERSPERLCGRLDCNV